ncbi:hypothetical protein COU60_02740 [Candidatus Pacearchaeota archaeon CG10_big_fil_rev_8_21_14_0_10_34_76]|nr:MAG: hypothetical protein COU60_02740 [Candidatus Pacearchaeota archaeon CG10_big_fil_rev_8_21_14_0_10_34_76]
MKKFMVLTSILFLFTFFSYVSAQSNEDFSYVISNSENWRDVYSTMHYANLLQKGNDFLVSTQHGNVLLLGISKSNEIRVISSNSQSFVVNYPLIIRNNGFADAHEINVRNANLELIEELSEINNFIIVGNIYGYNAIAVNPYALLTDSWVFMADKNNIAEIESILQNRDVNDVLIYGHVDREVRDALTGYDPKIISTGDRFKDNIEIVKEFLKIKEANQVTLTNGEFIEKGIMSDSYPILFTGKENVPSQIKDYLKESPFQVGVLVGSDLVGTATNIRRDTGMSVIVKFARGARVPSGAIAAVEGLDIFPVPNPVMALSLHSVKYNAANSELQVTYQSQSNIPIYLLGTITPIIDGTQMSRIGDEEPIFMAPEDFKTVIYPDFQVSGEDLEANIFTLYGDTPSSLEKVLDATAKIERVNVIDNCDVDILNVKYSKPKDSFIVTLENTADADCWASVEIKDLVVDGLEKTIGSEGSENIKKGKKGKVIINEILANEDLDMNNFVDVIVYYGEREDSLVNTIRGTFELDIESISKVTIVLLIISLLIVGLIIFYVIKRRNENFL